MYKITSNKTMICSTVEKRNRLNERHFNYWITFYTIMLKEKEVL